MVELNEKALAPCPFCGAPAEVDMSRGFRALQGGRLHYGVAIYCSAYCHVDMMLSRADLPEYDDDQLFAILAENWNKRPAPALPAPNDGLVERLKAKRMRVHDLGGVGWEDDPDCLEAAAALQSKDEQIERWRQNSIDTWSAMTAMRNSINEHVPMPSIEGDLLQGPENSVFCAAVASAVIEKIKQLTRERDAALENYTRTWNERDAQRRRAEAAEQRVQKLTVEVPSASEQDAAFASLKAEEK